MRRETVVAGKLLAVPLLVTALSLGGGALSEVAGQAQLPDMVKGRPVEELLSPGGLAALEAARRNRPRIQLAPVDAPFNDPTPPGYDPARGDGSGGGGSSDPRGRRNAFVNDPCLDPPPVADPTPLPFPGSFLRTVQSETEIAVFNPASDEDDDGDDDREGYRRNRGGRLMVAGYNDSYGFDDNRQGLSGFSYSTDGGKLWIDASGLPPAVPSGAPAGTLGSDAYFGDPVVVVDNRARTFIVNGQRVKQKAGVFYYASLYQTPAGLSSLSVNRGQFRVAPRQVPVESKANNRCENNPAANGIPDPPAFIRERIIWEPPVAAVLPPHLGPANFDFLDKEWLYVDQKTGYLFLTYLRFAIDERGFVTGTPLELVRSFDGGRTWTPPSVIVPDIFDTAVQATMPIVTPTGRVIVTWNARRFPAPAFIEGENRTDVAYSDNCQTPAPCVFSAPVVVDRVNPQGEPLGYNRARLTILNAPYIAVDKGRDDGRITEEERERRGFGNVYITYFHGRTALPQSVPAGCPSQSPCNPFARAADIRLATSTDNGTTWNTPQKVNDDPGNTTHVFPSVQVNDLGEVFVTWIDRRLDQQNNILNDTWGEVSETKGRGAGRGDDVRITTVSSDWFTREDARPDYGDYNSSELIDYREFVSIWADGRFPPGTFTFQVLGVDPDGPGPLPRPIITLTRRKATPDSYFAIFPRRGNNDDGGGDRDKDK